jgi:hypothetical protein
LKHYTFSRFWVCFNALPVEVQKLARRNYAVLKRDPTQPSLQFKLVAEGRYRSVRVGLHYRALGIPVPDGVQWFWIGIHAEYDRLIG